MIAISRCAQSSLPLLSCTMADSGPEVGTVGDNRPSFWCYREWAGVSRLVRWFWRHPSLHSCCRGMSVCSATRITQFKLPARSINNEGCSYFEKACSSQNLCGSCSGHLGLSAKSGSDPTCFSRDALTLGGHVFAAHDNDTHEHNKDNSGDDADCIWVHRGTLLIQMCAAQVLLRFPPHFTALGNDC